MNWSTPLRAAGPREDCGTLAPRLDGLSVGDRGARTRSKFRAMGEEDMARRKGRTPAKPSHSDRPDLPPSEDSFAALVRPHLQEVLQVARNQLGCEHLAWEAVQEALLSLWGVPEAPPNPKAWLIRAVIFRSLHLRRAMRRRAKYERRASLIRREADEAGQPSQMIDAEEVRHEVRAALERLGAKHREILTLYLVEGLVYGAIARRLDIPIGTVRSRLSRAREALMTHLSPEFHEVP